MEIDIKINNQETETQASEPEKPKGKYRTVKGEAWVNSELEQGNYKYAEVLYTADETYFQFQGGDELKVYRNDNGTINPVVEVLYEGQEQAHLIKLGNAYTAVELWQRGR